MSDFSGELCVVASALVSPLAVTPAAHAFFAAAGATPAAGALDGPLKGTFACPWLPADAPAGSRLGVLAAQAISALLDGLSEGAREARSSSPRDKTGVEIVVVCPGTAQGLPEEVEWLVERSARTAAGGAGAQVRCAAGARAWVDELLRAGRELSGDAIRVLVAVDSMAAPERAAGASGGDGPRRPAIAPGRAGLGEQDSPWDLPPPRRSEAAAGVALVTPARALAGKMVVLGRVRGAVTRSDDSTPDNDAVSDGTALSGAIEALPGRSAFGLVVGPQSVSGFFRDELEMGVTRNAARFAPAYRAVCPAAVLGDVGLAGLSSGMALSLAMLRHGTSGLEGAGPALVWDVAGDGTRLALSLEASADHPPAHTAARSLSPVRAPVGEVRYPGSMKEARQACVERLAALGRLRKEAAWRELPGIEGRILANLDALAEAGARPEEVAGLCARVGGPTGGFVAGLALGTLAPEGEESESRERAAGLIEETLVGLFGAEGGALLGEEVSSLGPLWLAAEGVFLAPARPAKATLERWLAHGPPVMAAAAMVALARDGGLARERLEQRAGAGEPLVVAAIARVGAIAPEVQVTGRQAVRDLLEGPGALAWEAARGLLVAGDDSAVRRVRAGDGLCERLGDRALLLLALSGELGDAGVFGRLARRAARSERALFATGMFGDVGLAPVLLDALGDPETAGAAERALAAMLGPAPERADAWREAVSGAAWARGVRARGGEPWSVEGLSGARDPGRLSDRDWQFRVDEARIHGERSIAVEPGGFGEAARAGFLAALGAERSGR